MEILIRVDFNFKTLESNVLEATRLKIVKVLIIVAKIRCNILRRTSLAIPEKAWKLYYKLYSNSDVDTMSQEWKKTTMRNEN